MKKSGPKHLLRYCPSNLSHSDSCLGLPELGINFGYYKFFDCLDYAIVKLFVSFEKKDFVTYTKRNSREQFKFNNCLVVKTFY